MIVFEHDNEDYCIACKGTKKMIVQSSLESYPCIFCESDDEQEEVMLDRQ